MIVRRQPPYDHVMALIGLQNVHKTLGDKHLLRGISLVVEPLDRVG